MDPNTQTFEIQGTKVLVNGKPAGSITENSLQMHISDEQQGATIDMDFTRSGGSAVLLWHADSPQGSFHLSAQLKRQ